MYPKSQETLCREETFVTMTKYKLEYIWLDGKTPVPGLRGKTLI
jgi:hypothetical protein